MQLELQPTTTVLETVRRAAAQVGVDPAASSLVFRGRVLQGVEMVGDAGIVDGSCVILARQRPRHAATASPAAAQPEAEHATPSPPEITLTIKRVGSEASTRVSVETSDTLQAIIRQLKWRWDVGDVRLVHGGRILHPGQRVSESGLRDGTAIFGMASQATVASAAAEAATSAIHGGDGSDEDDQGPRPEARDQSGTRRTSGDGAETCRICHGGRELESELGPLFSPCRCRGTVASVHVECLNRWRRMSANPSSFFACDQCGYRYQMDRTRWAQWAETGAAAEVTTVLACAFMVCAAAFPCYCLSLHKHFVSSPPSLGVDGAQHCASVPDVCTRCVHAVFSLLLGALLAVVGLGTDPRFSGGWADRYIRCFLLAVGLLIVPLRQFSAHVSLGPDSGCQRHANFPLAGTLWIANGLEGGACASPSICKNGYAAVWRTTAGSPTAGPGHGDNADLTSAG